MAEFVRNLQDIANIREIRQNRRSQRVFRPRENPFEKFSDSDFRKRYRFTKGAVEFVVSLIRDEIESVSAGETDISPLLQVLITLRFFAKGCYQLELGDLHGVSQPSASRIITKVLRAIASKLPRFITWPTQIQETKEAFHALAEFPGVVGCLDCTHIKIKNPHGDQPLIYCNRKGFYSLNVQVVCDATTRITDIVARWRGSAHDSRIWANSALKEQFEDNRTKGILLGDSGYACTHYMLTPVLNPQSHAEERYNRAHKATRVTIECCFGRWKGMFRALQNGLQIDLETAKAFIIAMAVLYNIKLDHDANWDYEDEEEDEDQSDEEIVEQPARANERGNLFRRRFFAEHFA